MLEIGPFFSVRHPEGPSPCNENGECRETKISGTPHFTIRNPVRHSSPYDEGSRPPKRDEQTPFFFSPGIRYSQMVGDLGAGKEAVSGFGN